MEMIRRANSLEQHRRKKRRFTESGIGSTTSEWGGGGEDCYLPEWFLFELLRRLPIEVVFRFKCVSREWLSFISDPSFHSLYFSGASPRCPFAFFLPRVRLVHDPKTFLTQGEHERYLKFPELQLLTLPTALGGAAEEGTFHIRAADKGFLLLGREVLVGGVLTTNYNAEYYICNAITKQWFTLPAHNFFDFFSQISVGFITQVEAAILTSYKVIIVHCPRKARNFLELQMFSSETGRWVDFSVHSKLPVAVSPCRKPVLLNNTLHWIDCELGGILAYDPYASPDKLRIIEFPANVGKGGQMVWFGPGSSNCGVYEERLKYFEIIEGGGVNESPSLKIWELQDISSGDDHDHQRQQNWCLQHTARMEDIIVPRDDYLRRAINEAALVSFHPCDPNVVYLYWGRGLGLVSYNIQTRRVESLSFESNYRCSNMYWPFTGLYTCFFFFLVLPLWPITIPRSLSLCIGVEVHG